MTRISSNITTGHYQELTVGPHVYIDTFLGSTVRRGSLTLDFELKSRISGGWLCCPSKVEASAAADRSGTATFSLLAPRLDGDNAHIDDAMKI